MKSKHLIPPIALLLLISLSDAKMRLYSRDLAEKWVTDSLHRIDSLQAADSLRVSDSMLVARYQDADKTIKNERCKAAEIAARNAAEKLLLDSINAAHRDSVMPEDVDNISARTIIIADTSPFAHEIDSLQRRVDSICAAIHDHDKWYTTMKTYPVSEKKRYMQYLMKNNIKDTTAILACCSKLYQMYVYKHELLLAIRKSQSTNTKSFMTLHIDEHKRRMGELSEFLIALSPTVPFLPGHEQDKKQ